MARRITGSPYGGFQRGNGSLDRVGVTGFERSRITGTTANDTVTGGYAMDDTVFGGAGNDSLDGYTGSKYFDGGAGNDTLYGSSGNNGTKADDTLIGGYRQRPARDSRALGGCSLLGGDATTPHARRQHVSTSPTSPTLRRGQRQGVRLRFNSSISATVRQHRRRQARLCGIGSDTLSADFSNQLPRPSTDFRPGRANGVAFTGQGPTFRNFEFLKKFASGAGNDSICVLLSGRADEDEIAVTNGDDTSTRPRPGKRHGRQ